MANGLHLHHSPTNRKALHLFMSLFFYTNCILCQPCSCSCLRLSFHHLCCHLLIKLTVENCSSVPHSHPPKNKKPADFCVFASSGRSHSASADNFLLLSPPINSGSSIKRFFLLAIEAETLKLHFLSNPPQKKSNCKPSS